MSVVVLIKAFDRTAYFPHTLTFAPTGHSARRVYLVSSTAAQILSDLMP